MSDWSSDAAKRIQKKLDEERIKAEKELQEDKLVELNAPRLWRELRDSLIQMCNEFNSEPGMQGALLFDQKHSELRIEYPGRSQNVSISFDSTRHSVMVSGTIAASYSISIKRGSREVSFMDANNMSAPIHEISKKTLNGILGMSVFPVSGVFVPSQLLHVARSGCLPVS